MQTGSIWLAVLLAAGSTTAGVSQQPANPPAPPLATSAEAHHDPALEAANELVGRALILRCFCAENSLAFDAEGHPQQPVKLTDWTLAGVNVQKAQRREGGTIELDGVRVAVRYAPDRHEFDRHPQNDEKVKILVPDTGGAGPGAARSMARALDAIFSEGIDLRLQKAMPPYWLHYFAPQTPWPNDALVGTPVVTPGAPGTPPGITDPKPLQRHEATYTTDASHDRVAGLVMLRAVVDTQGIPRRVAIVQPLGYGLDARAVEALDKFKFTPAMTPNNQPIAAMMLLRQEFVGPTGQ